MLWKCNRSNTRIKLNRTYWRDLKLRFSLWKSPQSLNSVSQYNWVIDAIQCSWLLHKLPCDGECVCSRSCGSTCPPVQILLLQNKTRAPMMLQFILVVRIHTLSMWSKISFSIFIQIGWYVCTGICGSISTILSRHYCGLLSEKSQTITKTKPQHMYTAGNSHRSWKSP